MEMEKFGGCEEIWIGLFFLKRSDIREVFRERKRGEG
jgi:hypothetical protein